MGQFTKLFEHRVPQYTPLDPSENENQPSNEKIFYLHQDHGKDSSWGRCLGLGLLLTVVLVLEWVAITHFQNTCTRHDTELEAAKLSTSFEKVLFSGAVKFDENGKGYRTPDGPKMYTGEPSPAIDAAWEELIDHRYFWYSEDEARKFLGPNYMKYELQYVDKHGQNRQGYMGGVDVFHTLHCLDTLRKAAHPQYYPPMVNRFDSAAGTHLDHCIDQIRQVIMCNADLTPVPVLWQPTANISYVDTDVIHTCRNFKALQAWQHTRDFHDIED